MRTLVVYATPGRQAVIPVSAPEGTTVRRVIEISGLLRQFPEIDLEKHKVGVFSKFIALDAPVEEGMRIEIYRPITADPATTPRRPAPAKPNA
jgi:hypothetical protein